MVKGRRNTGRRNSGRRGRGQQQFVVENFYGNFSAGSKQILVSDLKMTVGRTMRLAKVEVTVSAVKNITVWVDVVGLAAGSNYISNSSGPRLVGPGLERTLRVRNPDRVWKIPLEADIVAVIYTSDSATEKTFTGRAYYQYHKEGPTLIS